MGNSFFAYLQMLAILAFFSGYPLIYALTMTMSGVMPVTHPFKKRLAVALPYSYALVGTLYLGLQLKNTYLNYSYGNVRQMLLHPYLLCWAFLSLLFWIPAVSRKKTLSLWHSLVFIFFFAQDLLTQLLGSSADKELQKNDLRIYTVSLLLNLGTLLLVVVLQYLLAQNKRKQSDSVS
jgi:hypothetical protein